MQLLVSRAAGALWLLRHVWLRGSELSKSREETLDAIIKKEGLRSGEDPGQTQVSVK